MSLPPAEEAFLIVAVQFQGLQVQTAKQRSETSGAATHPAKAGFQQDERMNSWCYLRKNKDSELGRKSFIVQEKEKEDSRSLNERKKKVFGISFLFLE